MNEQQTQTDEQPCEGCGGLTEKNEIWVECWNCEDGYVESDDWQDWDHPFKRCSTCLGKGGSNSMRLYCCQECFDVHPDN